MALKKEKNAKVSKTEASTSKSKKGGAPESTGAKKRPPLDGTLSAIEKQYGKGAIQRAGQTSTLAFTPTGIIGLDALLGGGTAEGRVYEVIGPESSGKTTLATLMAASYQRKGEPVAMIDVEQAFDKRYAKDLGFDIDHPELSVFSQPDSAEQALDTVNKFAESGSVGLTIVDSVAALVPVKELEGDMGDSHMGLVARLMGQCLRKVTGLANKNRNAIVFINQIRMKIGVMYGSPETTPGGNALKFFASTRLDVRRSGTIKDGGDKVIGTEVKVKVLKNKTAPTAFAERTFKLYWGAGYDKIGDLISVASEVGTIRKAGAFFYNGDVKIGQGLTQAANTLANDEVQLRDLLVKTAKALIERKQLPDAYMDHIDFVLDGMKGGIKSPLVGFGQVKEESEEASEEAEEEVAS